MIALKRFGIFAKNLQRPIMMPFGDAWKDRDEAAEKVYISRQESTACVIGRIDNKEVAETC